MDMRADSPMYRLGDPGGGLRDNGRRVLTYAEHQHQPVKKVWPNR